MKMLGGPDPLVPICPSGWIDDDNMEVMQQGSEKKRRLKVEQVRALEKNFEVENKLEPERKARLAQELGLQPRQVAVWFQNRRARWKTKQLEGDYGVLKAKLDALRADYDSLLIHNRSLQAQVKDLQSKLNGNAVERFSSIKEEPVVSESETKVEEAEAEAEAEEVDEEEEEAIPLIYSKDGPSDSDSSAVLNDQETRNLISFANTNNLAASSFSSSPFFNQTQLLKVEEDNDGFFASDEPCSSSFFQYEQAPTMSWYCSGEWQQDIYE